MHTSNQRSADDEDVQLRQFVSQTPGLKHFLQYVVHVYTKTTAEQDTSYLSPIILLMWHVNTNKKNETERWPLTS